MRRLRFRVSTLLLIVTVCAGILAWYGANVRRHAIEARAISDLQRLAQWEVPVLDGDTTLFCGTGVVGTIRIRRHRPSWIGAPVSRLGISSFDRVEEVQLWGVQIDDRVVPHLKSFTSLKTLSLQHTAVTREAIAELRSSHPSASIVYVTGERMDPTELWGAPPTAEGS